MIFHQIEIGHCGYGYPAGPASSLCDIEWAARATEFWPVKQPEPCFSSCWVDLNGNSQTLTNHHYYHPRAILNYQTWCDTWIHIVYVYNYTISTFSVKKSSTSLGIRCPAMFFEAFPSPSCHSPGGHQGLGKAQQPAAKAMRHGDSDHL